MLLGVDNFDPLWQSFSRRDGPRVSRASSRNHLVAWSVARVGICQPTLGPIGTDLSWWTSLKMVYQGRAFFEQPTLVAAEKS